GFFSSRFLGSRFRCGGGFCVQQRLGTGDGFTHVTHTLFAFQGAGGFLETPVELLLFQGEHEVFQFFRALGAEFCGVHNYAPSPTRETTLVLTGSLAEARSNASRAIFSGTPSISNMMRPGFTRHTQNSTEPLPEPMRTSAGL